MSIITSFDGVTLEVGGGVETYWKSTALSVVPQSLTPWPHRSSLITSAQASPSAALSTSGGHTATVSSLRGSLVSLTVQVTRDFQPVAFSEWLLPLEVIDVGVCDVTLSQFVTLAKQAGRDLDASHLSELSALGNWSALLSSAMVSLEQLLKVILAYRLCTGPPR